jgi:hypothetical protein
MPIKERIHQCYQSGQKFFNTYVQTGQCSTDQLRSLVPTEFPTPPELFGAFSRSGLPHYTVIFSGLPFGLDELSFLQTLGTFNGQLPVGHKGIVQVNFKYAQGSDRFSGMAFVTYATSSLVKLAVNEYHKTFFCLDSYHRWQRSRSGDAGVTTVKLADRASEFRPTRTNLPGAARMFGDVWSGCHVVEGQSPAGQYQRNLDKLNAEIRSTGGPVKMEELEKRSAEAEAARSSSAFD